MASKTLAPVTFKVRRYEPELVALAEPTPKELKPLSDVDDQLGLRFHVPIIHVYRAGPASMKGIDPVSLIRKSLSKALVFYYPFAGRLRNVEPSAKLAVDCTGEGALFIEADAEATIDQLGDFQPPFPCFEDLLYDVPGTGDIIDSPIVLIQVTRFLCGGFTLSTKYNHTMADGAGISQFLNAIGEMARGAASPAMLPIWQREILTARNPPRVTCSHPEFNQPAEPPFPPEDMSHRSFFFGPSEVSAIRNLLPRHLRGCSTFDAVAAYMWRSRVISLEQDPNEVVHGVVNVNVRSKMVNDPLPKGYYGNAFAFAVTQTTAGELVKNPLGYAVELVRDAKKKVTEEFMRSMIDLYVTVKGRARFTATWPYIMSDVRHTGLADVDFGWGKPVYGGNANAIATEGGFVVRFKDGVTVAVMLPKAAMERFVKRYETLHSNSSGFKTADEYRLSIKSAL